MVSFSLIFALFLCWLDNFTSKSYSQRSKNQFSVKLLTALKTNTTCDEVVAKGFILVCDVHNSCTTNSHSGKHTLTAKCVCVTLWAAGTLTHQTMWVWLEQRRWQHLTAHEWGKDNKSRTEKENGDWYLGDCEHDVCKQISPISSFFCVNQKLWADLQGKTRPA